MKLLQLLPIGNVDSGPFKELSLALEEVFSVPCKVLPVRLDPEFAFHDERQQYHSSEILQRMQGLVTSETWRMLGIADVDLHIPILTFVFGEAQMSGPCAVLSSHRLYQEFYGFPPDLKLFRQRLIKESIHELGHTLNLTHCDDYRCVMASSHAVEWIDLKESALCDSCRSAVMPT
ncbi:MAG TPA: archaemetzincin family Zn-dependent metalloprotease [Candidatus Solibacter sp.]|nr:archaemetzincin family Zn-dependent metalloprotease [Candidatus Solibacter sp.]